MGLEITAWVVAFGFSRTFLCAVEAAAACGKAPTESQVTPQGTFSSVGQGSFSSQGLP